MEETKKVIELAEYYWINCNGCHYHLNPVDPEMHNVIGQFAVDTPTLEEAKQKAMAWLKKHDSFGSFAITPVDC